MSKPFSFVSGDLSGDEYRALGGHPNRLPKEGRKFDQGKPQWSLLPWSALRVVVAVLGFGAQKYAPNQWQDVPEAKTRYADAALRHLTAWMCGEQLDPESKLPHLAHAVCCLLFLIWFDNKEDAKHEEL